MIILLTRFIRFGDFETVIIRLCAVLGGYIVAKEAFSKIHGKIPSIKELNDEYAKVLAEKKKTYAEYRQARQDMKDYQTAKYNIDRFLQTEEQEKQAEKKKENKETFQVMGKL